MKKIAIVHEWLVDHWGSEKVVEQILNVYPEAFLFSLIDFLPDHQRGFIKNKNVTTTFIQKLPFAKRAYRNYLPLMPYAVEQLDLSKFDLIISSSHAVAKGVLTNAEQLHICYCHSPIRYAWDLYHQYIDESGLRKGLKGFFAKVALHYLRVWDTVSANRVDFFIANSNFVARRIHRAYRRESVTIYPPVSVEKFEIKQGQSDFYLTASRFVPYKKIDLIVDAFSDMPDRKLIVIGDGPDFKKIASNLRPNIRFLGYQEFNVLKDHMQRAKAFVFAAVEDFGITPVEAMACGTPVIALSQGGSFETVIDNRTGVLFEDQTKEALIEAVNKFESLPKFDPLVIRKHAEKFSNERFRDEFKAFVDARYNEFKIRS